MHSPLYRSVTITPVPNSLFAISGYCLLPLCLVTKLKVAERRNLLKGVKGVKGVKMRAAYMLIKTAFDSRIIVY